MTIKVIKLFGQVGSDLLEVEVLCVVDVVNCGVEVSDCSLASLGNIANQDGVDANLYSYRSATQTACKI